MYFCLNCITISNIEGARKRTFNVLQTLRRFCYLIAKVANKIDGENNGGNGWENLRKGTTGNNQTKVIRQPETGARQGTIQRAGVAVEIGR